MQVQKISIMAAVLMNINLMIGAGIFILLPSMVAKAGTASVLSWPIAALLLFPIVWNVAQLAKRFPGQGSFYSYTKHGLGDFAGFVSGWVYFVGYISVAALQTMGLRTIVLGQIESQFLMHYPYVFDVAVITGIVLLNLFNLRMVGQIQSSATLFKLIPLLLVPAMVCIYASISLPIINTMNLGDIARTLPAAVFGFLGFECCANVSHLIEGDSRSAYRAILSGFLITMAIYSLFHLTVMQSMGVERLATEGVIGVATVLGLSTFATGLLHSLVSASICVALIGGTFACIIATSSLLHTMAKDNLLFMSDMLKQTTRQGRPLVCLIASALAALFLIVMLNNQDILNGITNLGILTAFSMAFISLFLLQLRETYYGAAVITLVGIICCLLFGWYSWNLIGVSTADRFFKALPIFAIVAGGMIMYQLKQVKK